jgi:hypothetical protein
MLRHKRFAWHTSYVIQLPVTNKLKQEFVFLVNLVQTETVEDLVAKLQQGRSIPKEEVISDSKFFDVVHREIFTNRD